MLDSDKKDSPGTKEYTQVGNEIENRYDPFF